MDDEASYVARNDKLVHMLNMTVEKATPEYSRVSMPLTENHKNIMGAAHGGAIFALADVAFGASTNVDRKFGIVNTMTCIEYLRPGLIGPLVAEARLVRAGGHILSYDVQIFDGEGNLIAKTMASGYATKISLPE